MRQKTFADEGFEKYRKPTRREIFLDEMNKVVPWGELCELIALPSLPTSLRLRLPLELL